MVFFFSLFSSILVQYFLIISCKNIMSYNEELFLFSIYIFLFIIILNAMSTVLKNYIIKYSFNLIKFYENYFFVKQLLLLNIKSFYNILKNKKIINYILNKYNYFLLKNNYIYKNILKKKIIEFYIFLINFNLNNINLRKEKI